ncbi:hypothetical protein Lesp02_43500 [Lentzea sp. NBRC 105346]|uniref:hypothetical protein n=1 Tax=Lentzea sp. NBRC 105346 TaxID=3032205 RepID=UPI0024A0C49C|nr:hypothetical protein [Lentzea sp. NBRC 105346]GLZ32162.1 hypothetical protein Lesp02_43500 [Lentzea sp. NBRC 105346]
MPPTEKERLDAIEPKVATLISHVAQLNDELARVTARLVVLERRLSGAADGELINLDSVDGCADLVDALRQAWDAEQEILADNKRVALRQGVADFEDMRSRLASLRAKLDGRVPRYDRDALDHEARQLEWQINANQADYEAAVARLESDAAATAENWRQEAVVAGEKARAEMQDFAAARVRSAMASGARMPVWFRVGLGEIVSPDPSAWLAAATALVAYRLEYGIDDSVAPMGAPPSAASGSEAWVRRTNVHTDIAGQLAELNATFRLQ